MKKILLSLFFIFPALMFADVELDVGAYGGYNFRSSSFVESSNNFDCGLTGSFRYFFSRESIFGFGLTFDLGYAFTDNYDFSYKGNSSYHIVKKNTYIIEEGRTPYTYPFEGKGALYYSVGPSFLFRILNTDDDKYIISLSPIFKREGKEYLFADESNFITKTYNGKNYSGYTSLKSDSVSRFFFGIEAQVFMESDNDGFILSPLGLKTTCTFFEKSVFTNSEWKPCFNFSISVCMRLGMSFRTLSDRMKDKNNEEMKLQEERRKREEAEYYAIQRRSEIEKSFGDTVIKDFDISKLENPYGFEKNVVYRCTNNVWILQWLSNGFIGSVWPENIANQYTKNIRFFCVMEDMSGAYSPMTGVYMVYLGTNLFVNGFGIEVVLPVFKIIHYGN